MGKYLSLLNPEAVIFLNSCSNAEGGKGAKNLANFVAEMALGRKVIASEKDFQISGVKVEGMYPLNLSIFYGDLEVTFDSKKEGEF